MIIGPKRSTIGLKSQNFSIWTGKAEGLALPLPPLAYGMPALHAELLSTVCSLLEVSSTRRLEPSSWASPLVSSAVESPLTTDAWGFGTFWEPIREGCKTSEALYEHMRCRKAEIAEIRDSVRPSILPIPGLAELSQVGSLSLIERGISGSYILSDETGSPRFVIKPLDEDIGAINNPKGYASPFAHSLLSDIWLYRSCFREVAAFQMAEQVGVASIIPRTAFAILNREEFHDLSQRVSPKELTRFHELLGDGDKEKLCSVQEYVQESKTLFEALQELQQLDLTDDEIGRLFDQRDFEDANILLWLTGDTDGHSNNFLVTPKQADAIGNQMFGLRKIDNGFAFPEYNGNAYNSLSSLPNAKHPLSRKAIAKIRAIDPDALAATLAVQGLESSEAALRHRIRTLQKIVKERPSMSIQQINRRLSRLHEKMA